MKILPPLSVRPISGELKGKLRRSSANQIGCKHWGMDFVGPVHCPISNLISILEGFVCAIHQTQSKQKETKHHWNRSILPRLDLMYVWNIPLLLQLPLLNLCGTPLLPIPSVLPPSHHPALRNSVQVSFRFTQKILQCFHNSLLLFVFLEQIFWKSQAREAPCKCPVSSLCFVVSASLCGCRQLIYYPHIATEIQACVQPRC